MEWLKTVVVGIDTCVWMTIVALANGDSKEDRAYRLASAIYLALHLLALLG